MGTKERRQQEFAERELLFLRKTRELIRREGLLQVQMARVAEACNYSIGTLYHHFASKEDLLVALLTDRAQERIRLFRQAASWDAGTRDRMFAFCVADVVFVKRNPEYFRLEQLAQTEVVWSCASSARREACIETLAPVAELALEIIHAAVESGDLELIGAVPEEIAFGLWTVGAGTHSLAHTEGLLDVFDISEPYRLMGRTVHRILNGLQWKPLVEVGRDESRETETLRKLNELFGDTCEGATEKQRMIS